MDFIPDSTQLANIFSQAAGPAFLLGAVAGFISLLMSRLKSVTDQLNHAVEIADGANTQAKRKQDIAELRRRGVLLNSATRLALGAGIATTLLLLVSFLSALLRLQHVYGGALLFATANLLLMVSLYKFAQEVKAGLSEINPLEVGEQTKMKWAPERGRSEAYEGTAIRNPKLSGVQLPQ